MRAKKQEFSEKLNLLRSLIFKFDESSNDLKIALLNDLMVYRSINSSAFLSFHQLLLCMMAYPGNESMLNFLQKITTNLLVNLKQQKSLQEKLNGTGLLHTMVECNFSFNSVLYLIDRFPHQVSIHSASSTIETQKDSKISIT